MSRILQNWRGLVLGFLLLASLGVAAHQTGIFFKYHGWESAKRLEVEPFGGRVRWDIPELDRLYVEGSQDGATYEDRLRPALEAFPDDAPLFWWYCSNAPLPADFRETVARIAPENGWFQFIEAAALAKDIFKKEEVRLPESERGRYRQRETVEVVDEELVARFIELIREAISKPEFRSYDFEFRRACFERIPGEYDNLPELFARGYFLQAYRFNGPHWNTMKPLLHRASQAVEKGDAKEFQEMFELCEELAIREGRDTLIYLNGSSAKRSLYESAKFFQEGASELGLTGMVEDLKKREDGLAPFFDRAKILPRTREEHPLDDLASAHYLNHDQGRYLEGIVELADQQPMERAIVANIAWRKALQIFWIGTGLLVVLFFSRWIFGRKVKGLVDERLSQVGAGKWWAGAGILSMMAFVSYHFASIPGVPKPDPG